MAQFASSSDLAARLGLTLTSPEQTRADTLLQQASGLIQSETKQTIALVDDDELIRPGDYNDRIRLPQRPVVSVDSVDLQGTSLVEGTNFYIDGDELVRLNWNAVIQDSSFGLPWAGWGFPWWTVTVVYTHGWADGDIPQIVKSVCMEMVTRVWVNPGAVAREQVGNTMTVYDNNRFSPSGMLMTDVEKAAVNRVIRRQAGSIALR